MSRRLTWNADSARIALLETYVDSILAGQGFATAANYAGLPSPTEDQSGTIYFVENTTGIIGFRKLSGPYQIQDVGGGVYEWVYLGYDRLAQSIKVRYENNPDTNVFTDAFKQMLDLDGITPLFRVLASPPPGITNDGALYYDSTFREIMRYSSTRNKWLSENTKSIVAGRNGDTGVNVSLSSASVPTNVAPYPISRKSTIIGIYATSRDVEDYTLGIQDTTNDPGSLSITTIEIPTGGQASTHLDYTLNLDIQNNATLDLYISASNTDLVNSPRVILWYKNSAVAT